MIYTKENIKYGNLIHEVPPILYKYRSWKEDNHKILLTKNEVYFAKPLENKGEHHELGLPFEYPNHFFSFFQQFAFNTLGYTINSRTNDDEALRFKNKYNISEERKKAEEYILNGLNENFSIFCASKHKDNFHLWDTFAATSKGFCVGISTEKMFEVNETFGGGGMISYYDTSNSPHVYSMNVNDEERVRNYNKLLFSLPNKFIEEDEYRLIKGGLTKRNIPIPKEAIQEIFLGENCTEQDSTEIIEAVKENLPHIKIVKRAKFEDLGYYIFKDEVLL